VIWDDVVIEALCWGWIDGVKSQKMSNPITSELLPEKFEATGQKGTESMQSV
jgi:hypothetical protein